jgi:hypothetical protein
VGALSADSTIIEVTKLNYLGHHRLHATFTDGTAGEHDFSALVAASGTMGEPLRDPAYLARAFVEMGAPTRPNGFDVDPKWLRWKIETIGALVRDRQPDEPQIRRIVAVALGELKNPPHQGSRGAF